MLKFKGKNIMINRIDLIKKIALQVQNNRVSLSGIERQAVMLADLEYTTVNKKVVDNVSELD